MADHPAGVASAPGLPGSDPCDRLMQLLRDYAGRRAFNQYRDDDPALDVGGGAAIRRRNLRAYLDAFAGARFVLVGEGAGYAGCRFSGIPFTCEEQLVGERPLSWASGRRLARTSRAPKLWVERSATIVWGALEESRAFVLWNAFPWHPFAAAGPLTNRAPGRDLGDGLEALDCMVSLFPAAKVCAIGRVAEKALASLGIDAPYIRHPSHGGKRAFCEGIRALKLSLRTDG